MLLSLGLEPCRQFGASRYRAMSRRRWVLKRGGVAFKYAFKCSSFLGLGPCGQIDASRYGMINWRQWFWRKGGVACKHAC